MIDPRLRAFPFRSWLAERGWLRSGAAVRRVEIAPGTPRRVAPAVHLEDELDRIRGVSEFDTLEMQHRYATTDRDVNGPTCLVEVGEAVVNQEGAFWGRGSCRTTLGRRTMLHRGPLAEVEEAVFCSDWVIRDFFGHWLRDGLAQEMLAGDLGRATVALRPAPWLHEAGYRAAVGLHPDHDGPCHVRRLAIVEDVHFNDHRFARARRLRELFQNGVGPGGADRVVFMARGARGAARALVNEAEVIAALGVRPEDVLHPETSPVDHIRAVLGRAKLVVAVEGSAVMHAFLGLRSGAGVLVIQPPHRFNALARFYMNGVDIAYGFCVADPRPGGMHQPLDRLARLRDRMLDRIDGPGWPG